MDLFEVENENSNEDETKVSSDKENKILIWTKKVKKSRNMYMYGWDLEKPVLVQHHKTLKKKLACSGSLKNGQVFGRVYDKSGEVDMKTKRNVKDLVFHLQSGNVDVLVEHLVSNGVNEDNIEIKSI